MDEDDSMVIDSGSSSNANASLSNEFDIESYINSYTGLTKILRLLFIAEYSEDPKLKSDAFKMAASEVMKTSNIELYHNIVTKSNGLIKFDSQWVDNTTKKNSSTIDKLEQDLNVAKANIVKDSIRIAQSDLGEFYYRSGDYSNSLKCFVRTRDYCTSSKHILNMCFNIIKVGIDYSNYSHVFTYTTKAEQTPDIDPQSIAKLRAATGLANLESSKYKFAAKKFIETPFEQNASVFSDIISPQDIAIYGGLCALATFDRAELKKKVLDDAVFRNYLELVPEVRELIRDFYASKYAPCLNALDKLKPVLLLDIHLRAHVDNLYSRIRSKALIQYISPYVSVDLVSMATAFNTNIQQLEREISKLIMDDSINSRIDSHNKRLYSRKIDQRSTTFDKSMQVGHDFISNTNHLLLRLEMLNNNLTVNNGRKDDKHGGPGGPFGFGNIPMELIQQQQQMFAQYQR
ncbi:COP9 signalosome complex subunit 1 [Tieghemostelium lacteum]|uniref:COP9 signalosome complex subunit 1 n=1 Tax=Tieghemostelium lacteum TaxID=361077 RepID=A0A151ZC35_TIELA|nr:COP9 signalosome complex subunit 1 [Tieghemostelium lacteum]|eukprot:KYQ91512.1 COP9 signalosome complex subunit 1 [Tieghemostelium lacteum]